MTAAHDAFGAHILTGALGTIAGREIGPGHVVLSEERYRWLMAFVPADQRAGDDPCPYPSLYDEGGCCGMPNGDCVVALPHTVAPDASRPDRGAALCVTEEMLDVVRA